MQGVIKSYDPSTGDGSVVSDTTLAEFDLASDALEGSIFRMLRQGQRVVFNVDDSGRATHLRLGSEADMKTRAPKGTLSTRMNPAQRRVGPKESTIDECFDDEPTSEIVGGRMGRHLAARGHPLVRRFG